MAEQAPLYVAPVSIATLPTEVLLQIIEYLSQESLTALGLTVRRLLQVLQPVLYHNVWVMPIAKGTEPPIWRAMLGISHTSNVKALLYSIEGSDYLCSLIKNVIIRWNGSPMTVNGDIRRLATRLGLSSTSRLLHLETGFPYCGLPLEVRNVTSLHVTLRNPHLFSHVNDIPNYNSLFALFCIPSLRFLTIEGVSDWNHDAHASGGQAKASPVIHLAFTDCGYGGVDLTHVMSWPRALKSFRYELRFKQDYTRADKLSSRTIARAVMAQKTTLQELCIDTKYYYCLHADTAQIGTLQDLTALKRLALDLKFMTHLEVSPGHQGHQPVLQAYGMLPPGLEEVQIELDLHFDFSMQFTGETNCHTLERRFTSWLSGIPKKKSEHFPKLRKVAFWRGHRSRVHHAEFQAESPEFIALQTAFAESGIALSYSHIIWDSENNTCSDDRTRDDFEPYWSRWVERGIRTFWRSGVNVV